MVAQPLPAFDGTVFTASHVFSRTTGQTAVFGTAFGMGQAIFIIIFHGTMVHRFKVQRSGFKVSSQYHA